MQDHIAELAEVIQRATTEAETRTALDTIIHAGNAAEHHYRRTRDFLLAQLAALDEQEKAAAKEYLRLRNMGHGRIATFEAARPRIYPPSDRPVYMADPERDAARVEGVLDRKLDLVRAVAGEDA